MRPEFWWGGWWIFPIVMPVVMVIVMLIVLSFVFGQGGWRPPWWWDARRRPPHDSDAETAIEILKKRYARGEITKEEFERMKQDLLS